MPKKAGMKPNGKGPKKKDKGWSARDNLRKGRGERRGVDKRGGAGGKEGGWRGGNR